MSLARISKLFFKIWEVCYEVTTEIISQDPLNIKIQVEVLPEVEIDEKDAKKIKLK